MKPDEPLETDAIGDYAVAHCVVCGFDEIPEFMHQETYEDEWDDA
jgi:hypothetical protein